MLEECKEALKSWLKWKESLEIARAKMERFYPRGNNLSFCYDPRRASSTRNHVCRLASPRIRCAMALRTTTGKAFISLASSLSLVYLR